jgi:hypothetical protein
MDFVSFDFKFFGTQQQTQLTKFVGSTSQVRPSGREKHN